MPPKDSIFKYSFYARTDTGEIVSIAELQNVTLTEADEVLDKIDYVRVVRCKDCKYWNGEGKYCDYDMSGLADDYCSWGERREP